MREDREESTSGDGGEGRALGRGFSRTREYGDLMARYEAISQVYAGEIAAAEEIIRSDIDIEPSYLESLVKTRAALIRAERMLSLHLAEAIEHERDQQQQTELIRQERRLEELSEKRKEKEKELEEQTAALDRRDVLGEFFLPGRWVEFDREAREYDITKLEQEITKLEKEFNRETSQLRDKRIELGITSDRATPTETRSFATIAERRETRRGEPEERSTERSTERRTAEERTTERRTTEKRTAERGTAGRGTAEEATADKTAAKRTAAAGTTAERGRAAERTEERRTAEGETKRKTSEIDKIATNLSKHTAVGSTREVLEAPSTPHVEVRQQKKDTEVLPHRRRSESNE